MKDVCSTETEHKSSHVSNSKTERVHVNHVLKHISNMVEKNINADQWWKQEFKSK